MKKRWELWTMIATNAIGSLVQCDVIPPGRGLKLAAAALMFLGTLGFVAGKPLLKAKEKLPLPGLLPFLLMGLSMSGCAHGFGTLYGGCMESRGIQAGAGLVSQVGGILTSGNPQDAILTALGGLAGNGVKDAVDCWRIANTPPRGAAASPKLLAALSAADAYLARK
jgi:hypothetical protein